jgi:hypothetical protein
LSMMGFFKIGSHELFVRVASNHDPPDLFLPELLGLQA